MATAPSRPARTPKGERGANRILDAAMTVLARDGLAAATLGRIAAEAGVDKRMAVYYFGTHDGLLSRVVQEVGTRLAANVETAVAELADPEQVTGSGIDALWDGWTQDPELPRAYFALAGGSDRAEVVAALASLKLSFEEMFIRRVEALEERGYRLVDDRDGYVMLVMAIIRGLLLQWTESGDTPALARSIEHFKRVAMASFAPV